MAKEAPHLSFSSISTLERCGEQYRFRYVEGIRVPPGVALLQGKAVDQTVTADLQAKMDAGELLTLEQVQDTARDALVSEWSRGEVRLEDEYAELGLKKARALAVDTSVNLATLHHGNLAPSIEPTALQRKWELDVAGINYKLIGILDIQEGLLSVRDTKVSKKTPRGDIADKSSQLSAYALAVMVRDGQIPSQVILDYLIHTKVPKCISFVSTRTQAALEPFANRLFNAVRIIEAGAFMPAQPDSWVCSERWCGYHGMCRYAMRPVQVVVP